MTKCIVLGEQPKEENKKPIEFIHAVCPIIDGPGTTPVNTKPTEFDTIELIRSGMNNYYDEMFAYSNNNRSKGICYLGHWNDGVV